MADPTFRSSQGQNGLPRHVWVANIGGAGMSAVATLLAERGHVVSGHDPADDTPYIRHLRELGVTVHTGPDHPGLPESVELVVTSTATSDDAVEVVAARKRDVPVIHRSDALARLCTGRRTVAIAGTHGKSTTTAMLATVLVGAGLEPGWVVGAPLPGLGHNAAWGGVRGGRVGDLGPLIVEADESDGTFLKLPSEVAVVTNVEPDHLEHYGDFAGLLDAFERFLDSASGPRLVGADDELAAKLGRAVDATTVGTDDSADVRIRDVRFEAGMAAFSLARSGESEVKVELTTAGLHNVRNAAVALATAEALGVPLDKGADALRAFAGVGRRFEDRGECNGARLIDDYAHLPTEVAAMIDAARGIVAGGRVVAVFQPHRYSRTESLWPSFADAFVEADLLAITDVYSAGEAPRPGVSGKLVLNAVLDAHPSADVAYLPTLDDVVQWLRASLRPGDICLTLGAGDLTTVATVLQEFPQ